jgi:dihydropteroate synthase
VAASAPRDPLVRVEDASLVPDGGPARLVISRLADPVPLAEKAASSGAAAEVNGDRLRIVSTPSRIVDAAGRTGGAPLAETVGAAIDLAVRGWLDASPDLPLPTGPLPTGSRPVVMGILNVTPDSFSDGGEHWRPDGSIDAAVEHALEMVEAGADVIDVGGESTRPGADPVPEAEELERVVPVIAALTERDVVVSVDTTKAAVARAAVEAGAAIVNDVSAGVLDGLLLATVVDLQVPYVVMHMQGTPRTMQRDPRYGDVVAEVFDFLADQVGRLVHLGLPRELIVIDPGLGFGKTLGHNLELLRRTREFCSLGRPVLVGASRKSFVGALAGVDEPAGRVQGSVAAAVHAVTAGASIVRVHDVPETVQAVRVAHAITHGLP